MLIGSFTHTLDAKGRVFVPAKWRDDVGDVLIVTLGLLGDKNASCLFGMSVSEWELFSERLAALPVTDVAGQAELGDVLSEAGIPNALFSTKDYRSYMDMISIFTQLTGRDDLYAREVETVQAPIEEMIAWAQADANAGARTALLLRAFSTGVKAKGSADTVAGVILKDMGFDNIADGDSPLSENLSLEAILMADPDYVFVVTMGANSEAAMDAMAELLTDNPAWAGLRAVREGRYVVLDSKLFHYHPNHRWAESYAVIRDLIAAEGAAE